MFLQNLLLMTWANLNWLETEHWFVDVQVANLKTFQTYDLSPWQTYHQNTIGLNLRNKTKNQNNECLLAFYSKGLMDATKRTKFELDNCDNWRLTLFLLERAFWSKLFLALCICLRLNSNMGFLQKKPFLFFQIILNWFYKKYVLFSKVHGFIFFLWCICKMNI